MYTDPHPVSMIYFCNPLISPPLPHPPSCSPALLRLTTSLEADERMERVEAGKRTIVHV